MNIEQSANGEWYVTRRTSSNTSSKKNKRTYRNWFLIKSSGNSGCSGHLTIRFIYFPKFFVGKKIRLKVELEDENNRK